MQHDMELVSSFSQDSDFDLPFVASSANAREAPLAAASRIESLEALDLQHGISPVNDDRIAVVDQGHGDVHTQHRREQEAPKKPGISRSTYFRAKRNLKSHGSVRSAPSGKQIGRPQKLDANAERLIQNELDRNPAAELKQLQALVLNKCAITVSLSSISRRLKALGCSPSQNIGQPKRTARKHSEDSLGINLHGISGLSQSNLQPRADEFDSIPQLEDYDQMQQAFASEMHDSDLSAYHNSPSMNLDMLDMQSEYASLSHHTLEPDEDDSHLYKYHTYSKEHDLNDYSPGLNQDIYQHADHERQMLFNDPSLNVSNNWQEV